MTAEVIGIGTRSPVGLSSTTAAMNARASKFEPRSVKHLKDKRDYEVGVCLSGGLSIRLYGYNRLLALAVPAICEACHEPLQAISPRGDLQVPLILALAEPGRPDDCEANDGKLFADLEERTRVPIDDESSQIIRKGHAGGAFAIGRAIEMLDAGAPCVLVGAVDSYFHPDVLAWLDDDYRLHSPSTDNGFIPSEAAAFALLTKRVNLPDGVEPPTTIARIQKSLTGLETSVTADEPNAAECMTELVAQAKEMGPVPWVLTDMNGEMHRAREWGFVAIRHRFDDEVQHDPMPRDTGEIGAASAMAMLNHVCALWRAECAPASRALLLVHAEGAERGVIVVEDAEDEAQ